MDAQQEQGSLDQRHPPRDALGLAPQQAIQAAGSGNADHGGAGGAGLQLQVVRALVFQGGCDMMRSRSFKDCLGADVHHMFTFFCVFVL